MDTLTWLGRRKTSMLDMRSEDMNNENTTKNFAFATGNLSVFSKNHLSCFLACTDYPATSFFFYTEDRRKDDNQACDLIFPNQFSHHPSTSHFHL